MKRNVIKSPEVTYHLLSESGLTATTSPSPPTSKTPTIIRLKHSNVYGPVDAQIFVRVGDPKSPTGLFDFETASDWKRAVIISDLVWDEKKEEWVPRPKKVVGEMLWEGTYEAEIKFARGKHLIEIKFMSPMKDESAVFSNWEVNVK